VEEGEWCGWPSQVAELRGSKLDTKINILNKNFITVKEIQYMQFFL
jgi:hypothetical protein